jgi:hypothetical protein
MRIVNVLPIHRAIAELPIGILERSKKHDAPTPDALAFIGYVDTDALGVYHPPLTVHTRESADSRRIPPAVIGQGSLTRREGILA